MDAQFMTASMTGSAAPTGPERPLAADLAVEPVAMLAELGHRRIAFVDNAIDVPATRGRRPACGRHR